MDIPAILKEKGIKPSLQRIKILEYLIHYKNHPTVEEIHSNLVKEIPTLSKTTVYNTLSLLRAHKLLQVIVIEDHETRYDADTSIHGHFKCRVCGKINDFSFRDKLSRIPEMNDFTIEESHIYLIGKCPDCE